MNVCMSSMNSKITGPIIMKIGIYMYFSMEKVCMICSLMPLATRWHCRVATSAPFNQLS